MFVMSVSDAQSSALCSYSFLFVKQWMPTFSYHIKSRGLDLPHRHVLAQPSLDLICGLILCLDLCLITNTLPGAPDFWLNLAVIFISLAGGGWRGPALVTRMSPVGTI